MWDYSAWDIAILVATVFVAVTILVRLMLRRRDRLIQEVQEKVTAARWEQLGKQSRKQKEETESDQQATSASDPAS